MWGGGWLFPDVVWLFASHILIVIRSICDEVKVEYVRQYLVVWVYVNRPTFCLGWAGNNSTVTQAAIRLTKGN